MPRSVRSPEEILAAEKKDLYFIEFAAPDGQIYPLPGLPWALMVEGDLSDTELAQFERDPPGRKELLAWFAAELPEVLLEPMGPSEQSGFHSGGVYGRLRVDFDAASLSTWVSTWEDSEGNCIDPRFGCFMVKYQG